MFCKKVFFNLNNLKNNGLKNYDVKNEAGACFFLKEILFYSSF